MSDLVKRARNWWLEAMDERDAMKARIEALEAAGKGLAAAVGAFALAYEPMLVNWNSSDFVIASCGNVKITIGHLGAAVAALAAWREAEKEGEAHAPEK